MVRTPILVIPFDRARARKQLVTYAIGAVVGLGFAAFAVFMLLSGDVAGIVMGIVLALVALVSLLICGLMLWSNLHVVLGQADPALVVDDEALRWHQGVTLPWAQVTAFEMRLDDSISFAGGSNAAAERALEGAIRAGGVADGERRLVVHVRDRAAARALAGKADFLVEEGAAPGSGRVTLTFDGIADASTFAGAMQTLAAAAAQRGIPLSVDDRRGV